MGLVRKETLIHKHKKLHDNVVDQDDSDAAKRSMLQWSSKGFEIVEAIDCKALQNQDTPKMEYTQGCTYIASWVSDPIQDPTWSHGHPRAGAARVRVAPHRESAERWGMFASLLGPDEILKHIDAAGLLLLCGALRV